jgi:hypothetical protein
MKEQGIYKVVATESEIIKDELGQVESRKKRVIFKDDAMPAFDEKNAIIKTAIAASKVKGEKAIKDIDEVEVTAKPF